MESLYEFLLKFADDHWFILWCFGFLAWAPVWLAAVLIGLVRSLYIRTCRLLVVALRGWPPAHLDADGDWKPNPKTD